MFEQLQNALKKGSTSPDIFGLHPQMISTWLEQLWANGQGASPAGWLQGGLNGSPALIQSLQNPCLTLSAQCQIPIPCGSSTTQTSAWAWHHLAYAYLVESTGIYEILAEVILRSASGELMEIQGDAANVWLRTTEQLFFADPPPFSIAGVTSYLRPDLRVVRRNAYWRMFGLDVAHPIPARWARTNLGSQSWKQDVGLGVNTSFKDKLTELLRQVWLGFENRDTTSGPNPTDPSYIKLLVDDLRDMLVTRRRGGALAREEFYSVAAMSWMDVSVAFNTSPLVMELKAVASNKADRLSLIAQKVGMTPAPRSLELFQLAPRLALLLRFIELGGFTDQDDVKLLYKDAPAQPANTLTLSALLTQIINLWQSATGERVKDRGVTVHQGGSAQPLRIPTAQPVVAPCNGELMRGGVN